MYVIYTLNTQGQKSNAVVTETEEAAKNSIIGLMKNGIIAGYEEVEVWLS